MTTTRFTKEQLIKRLEEQMSSARYALGFVQDSEILRDIEMDLRLAEIARASLEAEPVSFDALRDAVAEVSGGPAMEWSDIYKGHQAVPFINFNSLARIVDKFRDSLAAPTVTFFRDGIEAAAAWVDQQRDSYDTEHGRHDPDTGAFEFGNDAQRDYSATLEEIAEGIRALHPNTAPPAPVVPDEKPMPNPLKMYAVDAVAAIAEVRGWNDCRAAMLDNCATVESRNHAGCSPKNGLKCAAMLQDSQPVSNRDELPEEKGASLQLRNLIRQRHAEWSDKTFGNVGPVGPLKHLSKEALEAVAEPDDLSEWADMQFLLWDAQRRAGISDGEITAAMEEKLKVNMARQWPEPKDGEPRLHIKDVG